MRALLVVALVIASASIATAAPWRFDSEFEGDDLIADFAYQLESANPEVAFHYRCDVAYGIETFYVKTGLRYEDTTSYAPEVPTIFSVDGLNYEIPGAFQNLDGELLVVYGAPKGDFYALFDRLLLAKSDMTISYFDKHFSFSTEGAGPALSSASQLCY